MKLWLRALLVKSDGENQTHFNIAGIKKSSANSVSKAAKIKGRLLKRLKMSLRDLNLGSSPLLRGQDSVPTVDSIQ
ncbi:unnamed protein product [Brassica oleracea]